MSDPGPTDEELIFRKLKEIDEKLNLLLEATLYRAERQLARHVENILTPLPQEEVHEAEIVRPTKVREIFREDYLDLLR